MRHNLSATQISLYMRHPENWRLRYLEREKHIPSIGDHIGADVHRLLAAHLRGEVDISPPGPPSTRWGATWYPHAIAAPGLRHLPTPGSVAVEVRRALDLDGRAVVCVKDAERDGIIVDHKTTPSLDLALADLALDVQAAIYAAEHLQRTGLPAVTLLWVWYATDGSGARPVEQVVTAEDVEPTIELVRLAARSMEAERCRSLTFLGDSTSSDARQLNLPVTTT